MDDTSMRFMRNLPCPLAVCLLGILLAVITVGFTQSESSAQAANKVVGPGESIQKAINAADPGDTIVVKGVHREDVVIRKNGISLRGEDAVIEAPTRAKADSPCSRVFGPEGICVLGDVNIETGELTGPRVSDVSVSGFTLRRFKIEGKGNGEAYTIDVSGARNATVTGNRAIGNVAGGIIVGRSINTTIANNDVIGNPRRSVTGISVELNSRNTKIANNFVRSREDGIGVDDSINTTIEGNDVKADIGDIAVANSTGTKILSNVTGGSGIAGIFVAGPLRANAKPVNAKIVGNDLSGSEFGIFVANARGGSITANEVHNNCAGVVFYSDFGPPSANFEVKGNTVENNTRKCPAEQFRPAISGLGIALFGARGMEVRGNEISGNVPSGPTGVSGGVVVGVDPLFGGTTKPRNNTVAANDFGRNKPDIFFDGTGSGNRFRANDCNRSVPARLCD